MSEIYSNNRRRMLDFEVIQAGALSVLGNTAVQAALGEHDRLLAECVASSFPVAVTFEDVVQTPGSELHDDRLGVLVVQPGEYLNIDASSYFSNLPAAEVAKVLNLTPVDYMARRQAAAKRAIEYLEKTMGTQTKSLPATSPDTAGNYIAHPTITNRGHPLVDDPTTGRPKVFRSRGLAIIDSGHPTRYQSPDVLPVSLIRQAEYHLTTMDVLEHNPELFYKRKLRYAAELRASQVISKIADIRNLPSDTLY